MGRGEWRGDGRQRAENRERGNPSLEELSYGIQGEEGKSEQ
jgi:hypothetical protein